MWVIGILLGMSVGFHIGWYGKQLLNNVKKLIDREPDQPSKIVSPLPPGYTRINNTTSGIVTPKSPAQIEREENQRLQGYE